MLVPVCPAVYFGVFFCAVKGVVQESFVVVGCVCVFFFWGGGGG